MFKVDFHKKVYSPVIYIAGLLFLAFLYFLMHENIINLSVKKDISNNRLSEIYSLSSSNAYHNQITNSLSLSNSNDTSNIKLYEYTQRSTIESKIFEKNDIHNFSNFSINFLNNGPVSTNNKSKQSCLPEIELWKVNNDGSSDKIAEANSINEAKILKQFNFTQNSHHKNITYYLSKASSNFINTPWVYKKLSINRHVYQKIFNENISNLSLIKLSSSSNITLINLRISINGFDHIIENAYTSNIDDYIPGVNNIFININQIIKELSNDETANVKLKEIYAFVDGQSVAVTFPIEDIIFYSYSDNAVKTFFSKISEDKNFKTINFQISGIFDNFELNQKFKFRYIFTNKNKLDTCLISNFSNIAYNTQYSKLSNEAIRLSSYYKSADLFSSSVNKSKFNVFIPESLIPFSVFRSASFDDQINNSFKSKLTTTISSISNYGNFKIFYLNGVIEKVILRIRLSDSNLSNKYLYIHSGNRGVISDFFFNSSDGYIGYFSEKTSFPINLNFLPKNSDFIEINIPGKDIEKLLNEGFYSYGFLNSIYPDNSFHKGFGLPYHVRYEPQIIKVSGSDVRIVDNSVAALVTSVPLRFSIDVSRDLSWIEDFKLAYNFSNPVSLNSCPINLQITYSSNKSSIKKYCIKSNSGFISSKISELGLLDTNYGAITKLTWTIEPSNNGVLNYAKFILDINGGILHLDNLNNFFKKSFHLNLDSGSKVYSPNIDKFNLVSDSFKDPIKSDFLNISIFISIICLFLIYFHGYEKVFYVSYFIIFYKIGLYYLVLNNFIQYLESIFVYKASQLSIPDLFYSILISFSIIFSVYNEFFKKIKYNFLFLFLLVISCFFIYINNFLVDGRTFNIVIIFLISFLPCINQLSLFIRNSIIFQLLGEKNIISLLCFFVLFVCILLSPPLLSNFLFSVSFISLVSLIYSFSKKLPLNLIFFNSTYISSIIILICLIVLFKFFEFHFLLFYLVNILFACIVFYFLLFIFFYKK